MGNEQNLMTAEEAAAYLRINIDTLRLHCQKGNLPHLRIGKKLLRFVKADLIQYTKQGAANV